MEEWIINSIKSVSVIAKLISKNTIAINTVSELIKDETLANLVICEETCMAALKAIHGKCKTKDKQMHTVYDQKRKLEELLYECRNSYVEVLTTKYGCEIPPNFLKKNEHTLKTTSMLKVLDTNKLMKKAFNTIMDETWPTHPKDEYAAARTMKRHFVIHCGATNTGKTYNALEDLKKAKNGVYLAPLRLLALEVFYTLNLANVPCTLSTGEEDIEVPFSEHTSSTIEKLNLNGRYEVAVIDEAQLISDSQRGAAWTRAILGVQADTVHICCAPDAMDIVTKLIRDCKDTIEVHNYERKVPLEIDTNRFLFPDKVQQGDALVCFSKNSVLQISAILASKGKKVSILYGNLPPETRRKQMQMFLDGDTDIVVTTDVIGMGLNLPVKRVVFMEQRKFDGVSKRALNYSEVKQIAGRAGRYGKFDIGYVTALFEKSTIREHIESDFTQLLNAYNRPADEYIINFPIGTLEERLKAWSRRTCKVSYFKNADITAQLELLETLKRVFLGEFSSISIEQTYKYIFLPFDYKNKKLLAYWIDLVKSHINGESIKPPVLENKTLNEMENYYRLLDLYYSFCKELNVEIDKKVIMTEKNKISEEIHSYLQANLSKMQKKCKRCGKPLAWDSDYGICDKCYCYMG